MLHGDALVAWMIASHVALRAAIGVVVPLERPAFVIEGTSIQLHQESEVGARASLGIEARFP
jgi:hypothetical protein